MSTKEGGEWIRTHVERIVVTDLKIVILSVTRQPRERRLQFTVVKVRHPPSNTHYAPRPADPSLRCCVLSLHKMAAESLTSIKSSDDKIQIVNQLLLPHTTEWLEIDTIEQAHDAIKTMKVSHAVPCPGHGTSAEQTRPCDRSGARQPSRLLRPSACRSTSLRLCEPTPRPNSSPRPNLSRRTSPRFSTFCSRHVRRPSTSVLPRAASHVRSSRL